MAGSVRLASRKTLLDRRHFNLSLAALLSSGTSRLALAQADRTKGDFPRQFRIGYPKASTIGILRSFGRLEKALAPYGVEVQWLEFAYGPPLIEGLNTGSVDVGWVGTTPPVFAQAGNAPNIRYVGYSAPYKENYGLIVPAGSQVHSVAELRGKKVAAAKGSGGQYLLIKLLEQAGLSEKDVDIRYLQYSEASSAFQSGLVDAWTVPDPQFALVQELLGARAVATAADIPDHYAFYVAPAEFAARYPAVLKLFIDELNGAEQLARQNPQQTAQLLSSQTRIALPAWRRALKRQPWGAHYPLTPAVVQSQQAVAEFFYKGGYISRQIAVRDSVVNLT